MWRSRRWSPRTILASSRSARAAATCCASHCNWPIPADYPADVRAKAPKERRLPRWRARRPTSRWISLRVRCLIDQNSCRTTAAAPSAPTITKNVTSSEAKWHLICMTFSSVNRPCSPLRLSVSLASFTLYALFFPVSFTTFRNCWRSARRAFCSASFLAVTFFARPFGLYSAKVSPACLCVASPCVQSSSNR